MRAKAKQAKNVKNRAKSERGRYIFKGILAMGLENELTFFIDFFILLASVFCL